METLQNTLICSIGKNMKNHGFPIDFPLDQSHDHQIWGFNPIQPP